MSHLFAYRALLEFLQSHLIRALVHEKSCVSSWWINQVCEPPTLCDIRKTYRNPVTQQWYNLWQQWQRWPFIVTWHGLFLSATVFSWFFSIHVSFVSFQLCVCMCTCVSMFTGVWVGAHALWICIHVDGGPRLSGHIIHHPQSLFHLIH